MLFAVALSASATSTNRQRAIAAYDEAQRMQTTLETQPEGKRHKQDYKKVIDAYFQVYRRYPAEVKASAALAAIADLFEEMGREYSSDSYFLQAIKSYHFLIDQYPQNRIARDALFTIGEVYRQDLEDPDDARKTFEDFLTLYPKSSKAEQAKEILKQLSQQPANRSKAPVPKPASATARVDLINDSTDRRNGPLQVTAVRRWVGPNYLRIVIELEGEVKFDSVRLANPDRIVVNLQTARLSPDLGGKTFPVENGFLRQIRVAQFSPEVARVVLDVERIEAYSIFSLPNPFRLVIDVQGTAQTQMAKVATPTPPVVSQSQKSGKVVSPATPTATRTERLEAAKLPPATPAEVRTATETAPPEASTDEATPVKRASGRKATKRENTETIESNVTPAIQPDASTESGSRTLTRVLGLKIGRIVIDPGHGGHDTGTIGPTGLEEKDVVLDVGLKLRKLLEQNTGCEVVMTRSDDTFIPLEERTAIANEKSADLFISVHANSSPDKSARGIETYYLNFTSNTDSLEVAARENASSQEAVHQLQDLIKKIALTEKIAESQDFAHQVQREVYTHVMRASGAQRDRGIKKAPFVVLIGANMPSVLSAISFLSNPHDEYLLRRPDYREKIAEALYDGILGYLKTLGEVKTVQRVASDETSPGTRISDILK
jgi:N-acetylmuramoyl-L-alanine amidase